MQVESCSRHLQVAVALLEEEVVLDELVLRLLRHAGERVVGALEVRVRHAVEHALHRRLDLLVVLKAVVLTVFQVVL